MGITHLSIPSKVCSGVLERRVPRIFESWIQEQFGFHPGTVNQLCPIQQHLERRTRVCPTSQQFIFLLSLTDERDRVQKKTFTKWVNKHLVKVRTFCKYTFTIVNSNQLISSWNHDSTVILWM